MTNRLTSRRPNLPRWLSAVLGGSCVVIGVVLTTRPFTSLSVLLLLVAGGAFATAVTHAWRARRSHRRLDLASAAGWTMLGVVVLAWPDATVRAVAVVAGVGMAVAGAAHVVAGLRGTTDQRPAVVLEGSAGVVLGAVALAWPAVTLLVVAVAFGTRTFLFGMSELASAARGTVAGSRPRRPAGRVRRSVHFVAAAAALVIAVALAAASVIARREAPTVDDFYTAPASVPEGPGTLVRAEPFHRAVPDGVVAWRILYTTTRDDDEPAVASGIVLAPADATEASPVIAWAHGTTGIDRRCAPSLATDPLGSGAFFALDRVIDHGWSLVATDYVGLGTAGPHPYLVGEGEARSVLDAVRAAHQLDGLRLAGDTVVWGHSQGGHAALWTGALAGDYAPDLDISGVAALAPASDLVRLVGNLEHLPGGSVFATYVLDAYSDAYPDVRTSDYVRPTARPTIDEIARRCLAEPAEYASILTSLATGWAAFDTDPGTGPLRDRLRQNVPTGRIDAPLLIAQGEADPLILPDVQARYVAERCRDGQDIDYRTYPGRNHVSVVAADSPLLPDLVTWTSERLDGRPAGSTCASPSPSSSQAAPSGTSSTSVTMGPVSTSRR